MKPAKRKLFGVVFIAVATLGGASYYLLSNRQMDDATIKTTLIGTWRAVDLNNGALSRRDEPAENEEVIFSDDGILMYVVVPKPGKDKPVNEKYSWDIVKGRLRLRDLGEGSTQEALPPLKINVEPTQISIRRQGYPNKVFERVQKPDSSRE